MPRSTSATPAIFSSAPDTRVYQPIGSIERCREQLESMLRTDAGLGVVIGPPGTGKSLLCQKLAESLRDTFEVVLLAESAPRDQISLLQNILFHLNLPYKNLAEGELRLSLIDRLTQNVLSRDGSLVLIVDEAQSLPDCILEEIRMITNIVRGGRSCVRTVLAGNHALEDRISQANMESLDQRIAARCYLHPFSQGDTARYVRAAISGLKDAPAIDDAATAAIHFATGGIPRLIHQMMRQVLAGTPGKVIGAEQINRAWSHSRQLASPVLEPSQRDPAQAGTGESAKLPASQTANADIVEYGPLSACPPAEQTLASEIEAQREVEFEQEPVGDPLAESMPEVAADLDRVTDSLLRIAEQDYDESEGFSEQTAVGETTDSASCDVTIIDASVQWNLDTDDSDGICGDAVAEPFGASRQLIEPSVLFGDEFEEEESVPGPQAIMPQAVSQASRQTPVRLAAHIHDGCEEERQLHREVADISEEAAGIQLLCDDACEILELPPAAAIGTDGVGSGRALRDADIFLTDDSDMLIIEEIVDIEPAPVRAIAFDDDPSDSVDYQLLLNRMRQV